MAKSKTKKSSNLILIAVIVILAVVGIGFFTLILPQRESIISPQCLKENEKTTFGGYTCPGFVSNCDITLKLDCTTQTTEPVVVYRATENIAFPQQMAVDVFDLGILQSWRKDSASVSQSICENQPVIQNGFQNSWVIEWNSNTYLCDRNGNLRYTRDGATIENSIVPKEPFKSQGLEIYAGQQNLFECSQDVTGDIQDTITYTGANAGSITKKYSLLPARSISWVGQIDVIEQELIDSECTGKVPGNQINSYFECSEDSFGCGIVGTEEKFCESNLIFDSDFNGCKVPYTLLINPSTRLYGIGESITGSIELSDTPSKSFIEIRVSLVNNLNEVRTFTVVTTNNQGEANFDLGKENIQGNYEIWATAVNHPAGEQDPPLAISIAVASPIFLRLAPFPDQIQFDFEPIKTKAFVTDSSGNPENVASWNLDGTTFNDASVVGAVQIQRLKDGEYLFSTPIDGEGLFIYQVSAIDQSGFESIQDSVSITVRSSSISIKLDLDEIRDNDEGRYTLDLLTLDTSLQPTNTQNSVIIIDSDGCRSGEFCLIDNKQIAAVSVIGSNGMYTFSHTFKDGLNRIIISSSSPNIQPTTQEFTVNLFPSTGGPGTGTEDGFPLTTVITVMFIAGALGGFFWLIFRKPKGRRKN